MPHHLGMARSACKSGKQVHLQTSQKKKHSSKARMPLCQYGSGCTRKDCVYRHETRGAEVKQTEKICMPFVSGICEFGKGCYNRHPGAAEVAAIRGKYSSTRLPTTNPSLLACASSSKDPQSNGAATRTRITQCLWPR